MHHLFNSIAEAPAHVLRTHLDATTARSQARVKEAAIGGARFVQFSKQRHEALAVECLSAVRKAVACSDSP